MKRNVFLFEFAGFVLATALGTLLHFVFDWTGAYALAPISAVNESTWEHMKILFFPMFLLAIAQSVFFKDYDGFWWVKLIGILVGVVSIPVLFHTVNGAFGKTPDWLNVIFFFLSAGLGYFVEYLLFKRAFSLKNEWMRVLSRRHSKTCYIRTPNGSASLLPYKLEVKSIRRHRQLHLQIPLKIQKSKS